uniref:Uncharacterized protein n=1 Tax=viral metagenome TaxID=1070528 RepID=A0A6C0LL58_9ZZZZ
MPDNCILVIILLLILYMLYTRNKSKFDTSMAQRSQVSTGPMSYDHPDPIQNLDKILEYGVNNE